MNPQQHGIVIDGRSYDVVDLDGHGVAPASAEHGERVSDDGVPVVTLPQKRVLCHGDALENGQHDALCVCFGKGWLAVKEPDLDAVDAADDSLDAMLDALAEDEAAKASRVDPHLGATVGELMHRDVATRTSSGSGKRKVRIDPKRMALEKPPSAEDGRVEGVGRKPRFAETRNEKLNVEVDKKTIEIIRASPKVFPDGLTSVIEAIEADPEYQAILAEEKRKRQSEA